MTFNIFVKIKTCNYLKTTNHVGKQKNNIHPGYLIHVICAVIDLEPKDIAKSFDFAIAKNSHLL